MRRPRDIAFLRTVYGCGLRIMEAATLRARGGIDRARMQIRVEGKGAKERVLPMSPHLLHVLEDYWLAERKGRPGHGSPWLFLGEDQQSPICGATGRNIYYRALTRSGVRPKENWRVYLKRPFGGPDQVLAYLANYTHRVAIANSRIRPIDQATGKVTITYRDYADGAKIKLLKLSGTEFIGRFSLHLLAPRYRGRQLARARRPRIERLKVESSITQLRKLCPCSSPVI